VPQDAVTEQPAEFLGTPYRELSRLLLQARPPDCGKRHSALHHLVVHVLRAHARPAVGYWAKTAVGHTGIIVADMARVARYRYQRRAGRYARPSRHRR